MMRFLTDRQLERRLERLEGQAFACGEMNARAARKRSAYIAELRRRGYRIIDCAS